MDWIAGSRMHFLEIILLRPFTTLPMYVLGFAESPLFAYIFFVYLMSVFVHSNIRFHFGLWHHGIEKEAIDVNYAVHIPFLIVFSARIICLLTAGRMAMVSATTLFLAAT